MTTQMIDRLVIKGYKSIKELDLSLHNINILIGANGSGKSNFVGLFKFINQLVERKLQVSVGQGGGANQFLHYGRKTTDTLFAKLWFKTGDNLFNGYACALVPTADDAFVFKNENTYFHDTKYDRPYAGMSSSSGASESELSAWAKTDNVARHVHHSMRSWQLYHFHDTGKTAQLKQTGNIYDNSFFRPDASNLAAYLYLLKKTQSEYYQNIVATIRMAAPFFGDFVLRPDPLNTETIRLEWEEQKADMLFNANTLSDGTLRFICLAVLFLQPPDNLPTTIVLDEPELGLHPYAITLLAEMIKSVSENTQVIVATQSVTLVNQFSPEDIIVVDREEGKSKFHRLGEEQIVHWMDDYGLGDLWEKNVLGGRPAL